MLTAWHCIHLRQVSDGFMPKNSAHQLELATLQISVYQLKNHTASAVPLGAFQPNLGRSEPDSRDRNYWHDICREEVTDQTSPWCIKLWGIGYQKLLFLQISPVLAYYFNKADSALSYTLLNYWLNLKILSIKLESSFLKPNMTV